MAKATAFIIKAVLALSRILDADFIVLLNKAYEGLLNNPAYSKPPVDLAAFKAAIDAYTASVTASVDGGKAAITLRDKLRTQVAGMYHILGHYVEVACNGDMNIFVSSGFQAQAPRQRTAPQPVDSSVVDSVDQGPTGQLVISITKVDKARYYNVRFAPVPPGATAPANDANWTVILVANTRPPTTIGNLTPGTTYQFQARAVGPLGPSEGSGPVNRMCI